MKMQTLIIAGLVTLALLAMSVLCSQPVHPWPRPEVLRSDAGYQPGQPFDPSKPNYVEITPLRRQLNQIWDALDYVQRVETGEFWIANLSAGASDSVGIEFGYPFRRTPIITVTKMRGYRDSTENWASSLLSGQVRASETGFYVIAGANDEGWIQWRAEASPNTGE